MQEIGIDVAQQASNSAASQLLSRLSKRLPLPDAQSNLQDSKDPSGEASLPQGAQVAKRLCENAAQVETQAGDESKGRSRGNRVEFKAKGAHILMPVASHEVHSCLLITKSQLTLFDPCFRCSSSLVCSINLQLV